MIIAKFKDKTGQNFELLTVLKFSRKTHKRTYWLCQCQCGEIKEIETGELRIGGTKSCGCYQKPKGEKYIEVTKKRILNGCKINENGCWIWKGMKVSPKYVYGSTSSKMDGKKKTILTHRLSYRLWKGDIPKNACVCHTCDIPLCINPDHLFLGSQADNQHDMINKGRARKSYGETCALSRFKEEEILEIRKMRSEGFKFQHIADRFKTTTSNIHSIVHKQSWKHI